MLAEVLETTSSPDDSTTAPHLEAMLPHTALRDVTTPIQCSLETNKMEQQSHTSDIFQKSSNSKRTSESWITFRDQFKLVFSCSNTTAEVLPLDIDLCQQLSDIINVSRQTTDTVVDLCH